MLERLERAVEGLDRRGRSPRAPGPRARAVPLGSAAVRRRSSADLTGDVLLRTRVVGVGEDLVRGGVLDDVARALLVLRDCTVKNAVMSDTRAACCMLCVTITIEYDSLSSSIRSSMRPVEIGSRAEQGSSMSRTSGSVASARAMHRRCCWPPDMPNAFVFRRSLTSSQSAPRRRACSTISSMSPFLPEQPRAEGDVVVDRLRERVRLLEHHADALADLHGVDVRRVEILPVIDDLPVHSRGRDQIVHPVQTADERRLAAARRADQRCDLAMRQLEVDARDGFVGAVEDVDVLTSKMLSVGPSATASAERSGSALAADAWTCSSDRWLPLGLLWHFVAHHFCSYRLRSQMATEFISIRITIRTTIAPAARVRRTPGSGPASTRRSESAAP